MRRTVLALGLVLLAGCSSNGNAPVPSTTPTPSPTKALTVDEQLRTTLLTEASLSHADATAANPGSRFDETENTSYSFVAGCGATFTGDSRIDGEWQASFRRRSDDADTFLAGDQVAVHYRLGAAAAQAEIRRKLVCRAEPVAYGETPRVTTAPAVPGVFVRCLDPGPVSGVSCLLVAAAGDIALAVTVRSDRRDLVVDAVRALGPRMRLSVAGRQPTESVAPSSSALAPPPASGTWTKAVARQRFATMLRDREADSTNKWIARLLAAPDAQTVEYLRGSAESAAKYDRIVIANLGVGRWPAAVLPAIRAARAALDAERRAYLAAARTTSLAAFRSAHQRTLRRVAATQDVLGTTTSALAGP